MICIDGQKKRLAIEGKPSEKYEVVNWLVYDMSGRFT